MTTKTSTARTIQAATVNAAGASTTRATLNLTTALGLLLMARVTNGATAPTVGCTVLVEVSNDNVNWRQFQAPVGGTDNSGVYDFAIRIPPEVMYLGVTFTGNTGQAVTVEAVGHELTSLG